MHKDSHPVFVGVSKYGRIGARACNIGTWLAAPTKYKSQREAEGKRKTVSKEASV